jgi:bla regulator protein BlaR1
MGFDGKENQLLNRAKRIIYNDAKSLNTAEKTFLSIAFVVVLLIMIANSHATLSNVVIPFSFKNKETVAEKIEKGNIEIERKENSVVSEPINQANNQDCDKVAAFPNKENESSEGLLENHNESSEDGNDSSKNVKEKKEGRTVYQKTVVTATDDKIQTKEVITLRADKVWDSPEKVSEAIIVDLKIDRIISGQDNLSYRLSDTKFIVNGVVQSDTVHKKFKQKYLSQTQQRHPVSDNISICYNFDISNLVACN